MAKAAGNSYPLSPTVTAPVADSTPMIVTARISAGLGDRHRSPNRGEAA